MLMSAVVNPVTPSLKSNVSVVVSPFRDASISLDEITRLGGVVSPEMAAVDVLAGGALVV